MVSQFDSITDHYAAKRKVATIDPVPPVASTSRVAISVPTVEPNKRQKTSNFGFARPGLAIAEQEEKDRQLKQRQYEKARAKRKSQATDAKKGQQFQ